MRPIVPILFALSACTDSEPEDPPEEEAPSLKVDKGIDLASKTIRIGALNDETGPAAAIGKPYAVGKRLLAARINAGGSGLLPDGWTIELVERDHEYSPPKSVQAYDEISDQVLFIGTSFGTPNTLPLRPKLEADQMVAFPASLSSAMAEHLHTPPLAASYEAEARRAMDFAVDQADGDQVKAGIVYQQDDYGKDGLMGWEAAAKSHGVEIVAKQTVDPGQKDMTAVITGLKDAGATHVLLTVLPSSTGPIVATAHQLGYAPMWIGATPAWIDGFYNPEVLPSEVFATYHQANSLPYWGEPVPGMSDFLQAYESHGKDLAKPDGYILMSYIQGLAQIEAVNRAIASGDATRAGYLAALKSMKGFDGSGMIRPINLSTTPYRVSDEVRILTPDFDARSWTVAMDYGHPGVKPRARPGADAPEDEANAMHPPGEGSDQ